MLARCICLSFQIFFDDPLTSLNDDTVEPRYKEVGYNKTLL